MNLEGVVLKSLLSLNDKEKALEAFSELRADYFSGPYPQIYSSIKHYYDKLGSIPTLHELRMSYSRDNGSEMRLNSIDMIEPTESILEAIGFLSDAHAQRVLLEELDKLVDAAPLMDKFELLEATSRVPMVLDEQIQKTNKIFTIKDINIFSTQEDTKDSMVACGISNKWDAENGGYFVTELILLGGKRGSGKSLVCANLIAQQHLAGSPSIYFTIEMTAKETMQRIISILSQVPYSKIRLNTMSLDEKLKVAQAMANLYHGGTELLDSMRTDFDEFKFQTALCKLEEKDEGRIVIVDDRELTISQIDLVLTTYKAKYGKKLKMVIIDYCNQVIYQTANTMYDWKDQTIVVKLIKGQARKHELVIVSPYQIDDSGQARMAKGILDACDVAQIIVAEDNHITFETTKARSTDDGGRYKVVMNWEVLTIDPREVAMDEPEKVEEPKAHNKTPGEAFMELTL